MQGVDCVSEGDLRAFLLGDLPGPIADMVAHHLDQCRDCEQAARRLDDLTDPIIHTLRRAVGGDLTASGVGVDTPTGQDAPLPPPEKSPDGPPGYEIVGELGRSGMSVVYQARQRHPQRTVALKMILAAAHAGATRRARFLAEADAIARLQHPNIVTVYEVGEHDGLPYLSLEYIAGGTLADRLAGVPQPPRSAAGLVVSLAWAVQYAHEHGVVHRDLKPSNVLLASPSIPKITDFGLAKQAELALTATGDILGTPQYMAPEQAGGKRAVGPTADIYALGAILYECLTGRPPFRGATVLETMNQVQSLPPVSPRQLQPKVPRDLETICLKCLEKEPARRYASAAALADDLGRFQAGAPVVARRAGGAERAWRWCHRNLAVAGLVASIAALLIVIAVVASTAAIRLTGALADSEGQRHRAETAETDLTRSLADLTAEKRGRTEELFRAYAATARAKRFSGQPGRRFETLKAAAEAARLAREIGLPAAALRDVRTDAIAALALADFRRERTGRLPPDCGAFRVWGTFAPDLSRQAVVEGGGVVIYGADDRPVRRLTVPRPLFDRAYFSPDGRHVIAAIQGEPPQTAVWDLDDPRPEPRAVLPGFCPLPSFRPDGRQIALAAGGAAVVYELATGHVFGRVGRDTAFRDIVPDPTGRRLAATERRPARGDLVHVFDLATGAEEQTWSLPPEATVEVPAWNDDGTLLAVSAGRNVHVWAFGDGPPHAVSVLERHQNVAVYPAFVPGTGLLVSSGWDLVTRVWDPVGGRQLLTLPGHVAGVGADGRIAVADDTGGYAVWRLDPAAECRLLYHGRAGNRAAKVDWLYSTPFAPDGRLLATAAVGGVRFWDAATGSEVGPLLPVGAATALFLPGGDLVTYSARQALRWPRADSGGAAVFGPPRWLAEGPLDLEAAPAASPHGGWLAFAVGASTYVVRTDDPTRRVVLGPHPGLRFLSLSLDGRRVASGTWSGRDVLVRDVETGGVVHQIDGPRGRGWFSPDGRRLATIIDPGVLRLRDVGAVAPVTAPVLVGNYAGAFTPDGRRLAVAPALGVVRLLDAADGRPLADLELPVPAGVMAMSFSAAGDKLAVGTQEQLAAVWDLAAVRRKLAEMGLDWDEAPLSPPSPGGPPPRVELVGAALAADPAAVRRNETERLGLVLWANPFDAAAYFERGRLLLFDGQPMAAHDHFTAALALRPDRPAVRHMRMLGAARLERWAEVLADADALAGHWPDESSVKHARAEALHGLGRNAEGAAVFGKLIEQFPHDADLYIRRAECYAALNRPAEAAADRKRAAELAPSDPLALNNLAWALVTGPPEQRDPKRAVALARQAIRIRPDEPTFLNTLGVSLFRAGQYAEAVPVLEQSLARGGGRSDGWDLFVLAMCRHRLDQTDRAKADLARALAWLDRQTGLDDRSRTELTAFRREAEGLLQSAK